MEVDESMAEEACKIVQDRMENTTKLSLDLVAIPSLARNLKEGH
jgi:DNA polymerase I-like protein with 3'-5' exonuclease and polymerase domains